MQKLLFIILLPLVISQNKEVENKIQYSGKFCLHRQFYFPAEFFPEVTGQACYDYGHDNRYINNTKYTYVSVGKYYPLLNVTYRYVGGIYVQNGRNFSFTFDYKNQTVQKIVAESFRSDKYYHKWLICCEEAEDCCQNTMTNKNIVPKNDTCPAIWDGWDCFNPIKVNTSAANYCPSSATMGTPPCLLTSIKECQSNAQWVQKTDYSTCEYTYIIEHRIIFHTIALLVANIICFPSIIIFFAYRALKITRVILHRNLLIAIFIKNIFVILSKLLITLDALDKNGGQILYENGVPCRMLAFFERVAVNGVYACMLVDGFYLHKIIVAVFRKDPSIYWLYGAVAVLSLGPILIWSILKASLDDYNCWVVDESWFHWIIDGSRYAMLGVNLLLLLDIIRVLVWKLKRNNGTQHTKYYYVSIRGIRSYKYVLYKTFATTLRATFILLPLFGIQFIMMSQRPVNVDCFWDNIFYYISYIIDSSQGILVSLLYCYFNKEVQSLLKKTYRRIKLGFDARRPTITLRRSTTATYVSEKNIPKEPKPKIIVKKNLEPIPEEEVNQNIKVTMWMQNNFTNC